MIIPSFYGILYKEIEQERQESKDALMNSIQLIMNAMSKNGPFFLGKEFGMVDIMLAPYAQRIPVLLNTYRRFDIPDNEKFSRYYQWWNAVKEVDAVKKTFQPEDNLIARLKCYTEKIAKTG